jgi:RNA polymerase-binding transcription factor DksA
MSDIADQAEHQEEMARNMFIKCHQNRQKEQAEFDSNGDRICLDCGELINALRVKAIDAVRCIYCQEILEKTGKLWS